MSAFDISAGLAALELNAQLMWDKVVRLFNAPCLRCAEPRDASF